MNKPLGEISNAFALLITGFGIGWLAGLSLSPVIGTILAGIMGAASGVVAAVASVGSDILRRRVNAWPAAVLVVGVVVGSSTGIVARSRNLFGSAVIGEQVESVPSGSMVQDPRVLAGLTALYSAGSDDCKRLLGSPDQALIGALETSRFPWAQRLAKRVSDPKVLREVVECLCEP
jgi:hypothetical protein